MKIMFSSKFKVQSSKFIFVVFVLFLTYHFSLITSHAEPNCDNPGPGDLDYCLQKIEEVINALKPAQEYNKKELADLRDQIRNLEKKIDVISNQLEVTYDSIQTREEDLAFAEHIFEEKANSHYKFIRLYDPILPFLSTDRASKAFREITYRTKVARQDIDTMQDLANDLLELKRDKENFKKNRANLASLKDRVDQRAQFLASEVEKTESYLATLSAKQEELLALKAGGFQTSVGETPPTLEPCSGPPGSANFCDPGFRPAFAAFSFGAPHRTGMSQYGAYGRSKEGQSAETILTSYYQGAEFTRGYPVPSTINVSGYGNIPFEDNYLLGIYEVPESWGDKGGFEALKAQAVAARSYAIAKINGGGCPKGNPGAISPTEACQVYKPQLKSGKWAEAVRATRGLVMTRGGLPASTYYASTSGGFTITNWGWTGIKDARNNDWPNQAYEKIAGSPWFYKGWYKTRGGASCGRSNPWLTDSEIADILNARHVLDGKGGDSSRISPVDTNCWGGNPYSISELQGIGGFTSVSSVSVVYGNDGSTLNVTFSTNKGNQTISGSKFKEAFNLRAPGYIGLKSSLFNVEKL
jgi:peptidoglycan hydrolase CwlO-like protein